MRGTLLPAMPYVVGIDIPRGTPYAPFIEKMETRAEVKALEQASGSAGPSRGTLRRLAAKFPDRAYNPDGSYTTR